MRERADVRALPPAPPPGAAPLVGERPSRRDAQGLLPARQAAMYYRLEPYGTFILMGLIMLGVLGKIMMPIIRPLLGLLLGNGGF